MKIGSTFNHKLYGPLKIVRKRYSRMGNKSLWIGIDEQGEEHELDGSEKPAKPEKSSPQFLKEAAEMFGMTQGPEGKPGMDADEEAIIQAVFEKVVPLIPVPENGKDGADADTELIIREMLPLVMEKMPKPEKINEASIVSKVLSRIRIPQDGKDGEKGKDGSPDTPVQVKEKLETLKGDERLDASAIKNLPKAAMQFGGGDSYTGLAKVDSQGTPGTLEEKLVAGTNVTITKVNDTLRIDSSGGGGGGTGTVDTIVAGNNIDVDATDPANPIVSVETLTLADISDITASATEVNYTDGVTSSIQTQLNAKQGSITSGDTQVLFSDGANTPAGDAGLTYNKTTDALTIGGGLTVDTTTLVVDATNNRVGMGTTTPGGLLQLSGTGTDTALLGATAGTTSNALLNLSPSSDGIVRWGLRIGATAAFPLNIDYRDSASGNPTNLVQMTRTGFFGINGTPTAKLHVRESTDSSSVQVAIFEGDRATPAANDEAYITVKLSDAAGTQTETARITSSAASVSAGAMTALMRFGLISTGTLASRMELSPSTLYPTTSDGVSLGSSTKNWSDLFLASGGVINWAASDFTLTHSTGVLTASGSLTAATFRSTSGGLVNNSSSNNARYQPASTGSTIDRNIADSSPCLIVQQVHASSTGDILQVKNNASTVLTIAQTGAATFTSTLSIGTSNALTAGTIELGNASDTTLSRSAAGVLAVEGVVIPSISSTNTLTNKRVTPRTGTTTSSATPTINTDNVDFYSLTAQTTDITSFTTNLSGTPTEGQKLWIAITGTGARAITWGSSFEASTVALPTTTVTTNRLDVGFVWNTVTSKWRCVATC